MDVTSMTSHTAFPTEKSLSCRKKINSRVIFLHVIANCFKVVQIFFYYNIRDLPPPIKVYKCVMLMPSCPSAYMIILNEFIPENY